MSMPSSGKPVKEDDEVKGYQRGEDEYVLLEDDELEAVGLESTRTIDIERLPRPTVSAGSGTTGHTISRPTIRLARKPSVSSAMRWDRPARSASLALSCTAASGLSCLNPKARGSFCGPCATATRCVDPDDYFAEIGESKIDPKLMNLVTTLIDERTKAWDPAMVRDPVQARLLDIIASKKKGRKRPAKSRTETEAPPSNVINIMDALRRSIGAEGKKSKLPDN